MQDLLKTQRTHKKGWGHKLLHSIQGNNADWLSLGRHSHMFYFLFSCQLICPQRIGMVMRWKHHSWLRKLHLPLQVSSFQRDEAPWAEFLLLSLVITEEKHLKHFRYSWHSLASTFLFESNSGSPVLLLSLETTVGSDWSFPPPPYPNLPTTHSDLNTIIWFAIRCTR